MKPDLFQDEDEMRQHLEAISSLCDEFPGRQRQISERYRENLKPLLADATIRTYLPIFVSRKVKADLLHEH
ncbi:MAG: DUF3562 domain-containing protein [Desulfuromonadales bacterium]|nr:DUF3562 domain-containing protein [Desulfuromonadales bacterium]